MINTHAKVYETVFPVPMHTGTGILKNRNYYICLGLLYMIDYVAYLKAYI